MSAGKKIERKIVYFLEAGEKNTESTIELVKERAKEIGIKQTVVASNSGSTAVKLAKTLKGLSIKIVVVAGHYGHGKQMFATKFKDENMKQLKAAGIPVIFGTQALSSVDRSLRAKWQGIYPTEIIAATFKRFSQGMKVCAEIAVMAADAGELSPFEEAIAVGGTVRGADTAVILMPTHQNRFFDPETGLKIKEVICMPRERSPLDRPPYNYL